MTELAKSLSLERFLPVTISLSPVTMTRTTLVIWTSMRLCWRIPIQEWCTVHAHFNAAQAQHSQACSRRELWMAEISALRPFDAAYNYCANEFVILGIGINSMGAHFNPVSLSTVNSESKAAITASWEATIQGL